MDAPGPVIERGEDDGVAELAQIDQVPGDLVEAVDAELPAGPELAGEAEAIVVGAFRTGRGIGERLGGVGGAAKARQARRRDELQARRRKVAGIPEVQA